MKNLIVFVASILTVFHDASTFDLSKKEVDCGKKFGLENLTFDDWYVYTYCPETKPKYFNKVVHCALEGTLISETNELNITELSAEIAPFYKALTTILREIPVIDDKDEYAFQIFKAQYDTFFHQIPPPCRNGTLNKKWTECRISNGVPPMTIIEVQKTVRNSSNQAPTSQAFMEFILCGLKLEGILKKSGELQENKIVASVHFKDKLHRLKQISVTDNKAEYALSVLKTILT